MSSIEVQDGNEQDDNFGAGVAFGIFAIVVIALVVWGLYSFTQSAIKTENERRFERNQTEMRLDRLEQSERTRTFNEYQAEFKAHQEARERLSE